MSHIVIWKHEPDEHDYPAATDYLSLLADDAVVKELVAGLQAAPIRIGKAKDILRASRLDPLPTDNQHVAKDIQKVHAGTPLSPVLLVRGEMSRDLPIVIADGYHRVCASYHLDENTDIPFKMAAMSA